MVAVKISDGLGNQLFQYATAYSVSKRIGGSLILDHSILDTSKLRSYELDRFCLKCDEVTGVSRFPTKPLKVLMRAILHKKKFSSMIRVDEKENYGFDPTIFEHGDHIYLNGYWQNYRYFADCRKDLSEMIRPAFMMSLWAEEKMKVMETENSVSVHIRRGDYVGKADLPVSYYETAIARMRKTLEEPVFYIFSDDTEYIKEVFGTGQDIRIIQNPSENRSVEDFLLMKHCRHHIIANSSYSWWAAYASLDGTVICPIYRAWKREFYPEEWEYIEADEAKAGNA